MSAATYYSVLHIQKMVAKEEAIVVFRDYENAPSIPMRIDLVAFFETATLGWNAETQPRREIEVVDLETGIKLQIEIERSFRFCGGDADKEEVQVLRLMQEGRTMFEGVSNIPHKPDHLVHLARHSSCFYEVVRIWVVGEMATVEFYSRTLPPSGSIKVKLADFLVELSVAARREHYDFAPGKVQVQIGNRLRIYCTPSSEPFFDEKARLMDVKGLLFKERVDSLDNVTRTIKGLSVEMLRAQVDQLMGRSPFYQLMRVFSVDDDGNAEVAFYGPRDLSLVITLDLNLWFAEATKGWSKDDPCDRHLVSTGSLQMWIERHPSKPRFAMVGDILEADGLGGEGGVRPNKLEEILARTGLAGDPVGEKSRDLFKWRQSVHPVSALVEMARGLAPRATARRRSSLRRSISGWVHRSSSARGGGASSSSDQN